MSIELSNSSKSNKHINCLIYGESGIGKTPLAATAPKPIFIDADRGLLSVSHLKIPSIKIENFEDLNDAYSFVKSKKGKNFETVIIDDLTEVVEFVQQELEDENTGDKWEVFAKLGKRGKKIIRKFKKLKKNVIFICKLHEVDDDGEILRRPKLAGRVLPEALPFMVDEVFAVRTGGKGKNSFHYLTTVPNNKWYGKDRSRTLEKKEKSDMDYIFKKIRKGKIIR